MCRLPHVGHTVTVAVKAGGNVARAEIRFRIAVHIAHQVDAAPFIRHAAFVGAGAVACLLGIAGIHVVAIHRRTGIVQHLVESVGRAVCRHHARLGRLVELDAHAVGAAVVLLVGHAAAVVVVRVGHVSLTVDGVGAVVVAHVGPAGLRIVVQLVAAEVVAARQSPVFRIVLRVAAVAHADGGQTCGAAPGATLVVVVHEIDVATARAAIAAVAAVIHHAVAVIYNLGLHRILPLVFAVQLVFRKTGPVVARSAETRGTVVHVHDDVVVK